MNIRYYYRKFIEKSRSFLAKIFRRPPVKQKPPSGVYHWVSVASMFRSWLTKPKAFFAGVFRSISKSLKSVAKIFRRGPVKPNLIFSISRRTSAKPKPIFTIFRRVTAKPKHVSSIPRRVPRRTPAKHKFRAWLKKPAIFFSRVFQHISGSLKSAAKTFKLGLAKLKPVFNVSRRVTVKPKHVAGVPRRVPRRTPAVLKFIARLATILKAFFTGVSRRVSKFLKPVTSFRFRVSFATRFRIWFATKPKAFFAGVFRIVSGCLKSVAKGFRRVLEMLKSAVKGLRQIPEKLKSVAIGVRRVLEKLKSIAKGLRQIPEKLKSVAKGFRRVLEKLKSAVKGLRQIPEKLKFAVIGFRRIPEKLKSAFKGLRRVPEKLKSAVTGFRRVPAETRFRSRRFRRRPARVRLIFTKYLNNKRIDMFLLIVVIVALATTATNQTVRRNNNLDKHIELVISMQNEDLFGSDVFSSLVQEFEENNPGLRIRINQLEKTSDSPDDITDIVFFDDGEYSRLMTDSALASLTSYIDTEEQTEQWALQLVSFLDIFFYNIDILQTANSDRPPRTRNEFLNAARAVARQGIAPLAIGLDVSDPLALRRDIFPWIWAAGGELYNENGTLTRIAAETIDFFNRLHREGLLAPGSLTKTGTQRIEEFAEGTIAMLAASSRDISFIQRTAGDINFGITAMPAMVHGKNRLGLSGIYAGISADSLHKDDAWIFLEFIAEKSQVLAEALGAVPGIIPSLFPGDYIVKDTLYSKAWDIFEAADIIEYHPVHSVPEEIEHDIWERLTEAFEG